MNRNVVVGYDGSSESKQALSWALRAAELRGLGVTVVHALTVLPQVPLGYGIVSEPSREEYRRLAEEILEGAKTQAAEDRPQVAVTTTLVEDTPAAGLLSMLADADLLVLGSRGLGTFSELLLGSVSLEVASRAPCPVVVFRAGVETVPSGPEAGRVVVGVDGSPSSENALAAAFEEASLRSVGITALHAWTYPFYDLPGHGAPIPDSVVVDAFDGDEALRLSEQLAGWREKYPDVEVRQVVHKASPAEALTNASGGAELVVVGSRGRGGFKSLLLGSVSHAVLHHAHCPVMVVRSAPH